MRETGKQRALRIPLDYFRDGDALQRWKATLGLVALLIPVAWVSANYFRGETAYSRGPVAKVHAAWEENCQACHVPFTPIRGSGWTAPVIGSSKESSERCQTCHAGPPHHVGQTPDLACAACHHDHQGRTASLVQLPDSDCMQCHAELKAHGGTGHFQDRITVFGVESHPDFLRSVTEDPGKLKFNHALHMTWGLTYSVGKNPGGVEATNSNEFTLGDIAAAERGRYQAEQGKKNDSDAVQLSCSSCHRLDRGHMASGGKAQELSGNLRAVRDAGAYMLPVTYETDCQGCHPLTVRGPKDGGVLTIPHRLQPKEVRDFLWGALAHREVELRAWPPSAPRPLPGKPLPSAGDERGRNGKSPEVIAGQIRSETGANLRDKVEQYLYKEKLTKLEKQVFWGRQTCGECHYYDAPANPASARITPTRVQGVWFEHARFNHAAHHAIDCLACHEQARTSSQAKDILIPGIKNCVQCHAPHTRNAGSSVGGVAFGCTECHDYHHRNDASRNFQGRGSNARAAANRFESIHEFLDGRRKSGDKHQ